MQRSVRKWRTKKWWGWGAIAFCLVPAAALAHGAHVQSRTATAIEIQAAYDTGEPMAAAQVQVFAPDDPQTPAATGVTDATGKFAFVPDQPGQWEFSVRQAGHGDIAVVTVTESGAMAESFAANGGGLSPLQRVVVVAAVAWGCLGTALYFWRGKR